MDQTPPRNEFTTPVDISLELADFLGCSETTKKSRVDITTSICKYISDHKLQNPNNKYEIVLDKTLQLLFNVDRSVNYAELQCFIIKHMTVSPIDMHNRKFRHVMSDLTSLPKSQSSRRDLRRLARSNCCTIYNDSSDSEDESNYEHVTGRSLLYTPNNN